MLYIRYSPVSQSQYKVSNSPPICQMKDEVGPQAVLSASCFLQCHDTACLVTSSPYEPVMLVHIHSFQVQNKKRKWREPPASAAKRPLNQRWSFCLLFISMLQAQNANDLTVSYIYKTESVCLFLCSLCTASIEPIWTKFGKWHGYTLQMVTGDYRAPLEPASARSPLPVNSELAGGKRNGLSAEGVSSSVGKFGNSGQPA